MRLLLVFILISVVAAVVYFSRQSAPPDPEPRATPSPGVGKETIKIAVAVDNASVLPSFDVIRVSPQGNAVIAGRAAPRAQVTITDDDVVIATVIADDHGEWVALPEAPLKPGNLQLSLTQRSVEGKIVESESVIVLIVPERDEDDDGANQGALAFLMKRGAIGGVTLLQEPTGGIGLKGSKSLSLDAIEYDDSGAFVLSGRADPGSRISAYIDDKFIGDTAVNENRQWRITPGEPVTPGLHALWIDQTDASDKVIARLETPFSRANSLMPAETTQRIVVQPGNSLWRIARQRYGKGPRYVQIFEANRDKIANPDLIYPGQIFELPTAD